MDTDLWLQKEKEHSHHNFSRWEASAKNLRANPGMGLVSLGNREHLSPRHVLYICSLQWNTNSSSAQPASSRVLPKAIRFCTSPLSAQILGR